MPNGDVVASRRQALDRLDEEQLARLLTDVPLVADALRGEGPLAAPRLPRPGGGRSAPPPPSRSVLAQLLATDRGTYALAASLDWFQLRLVGLAAYHGGTLAREHAIAEVGAEHLEAVEDAARLLAGRLLAEIPDEDGVLVRLLPGIAAAVGLPGLRLARGLEHLTSDLIGKALRKLGEAQPSRKTERIERLRAVVADPSRLVALREQMPDDVRELFDRLLQGPLDFDDIDGYWTPATAHYRARYRPDTPLHWLTDRLLAWADPYEGVAFTWLEAQVAARGHLYADWDPHPPGGAPQPLADPGPFVPAALTRLETLLERWAVEPAQALKTGGIGVRPIKDAAKALGVQASEVALLAALAVELGLLGRVQTGKPTGRGRNRTAGTFAWAPTGLRADWSATDPVQRWAMLVGAWLDCTDLDETADGLPNRFEPDPYPVAGPTLSGPPQARRAVLDVLHTLPSGTGLAAAELARRAWWTHPAAVDTHEVGGIVAALRLLGLVPADGPVGLTDLARTLLVDPSAAEGQVHTRRGALTVQADQTVMAPPETAPEVVARLERYAELESDAGVRLYRLSDTRLGIALAAGETADEIVEFLRAEASTALPQNVEYLLHDLARASGRLRAGTAMSYVRCDDPALLARAAGYKTAKLRLLAPTVAVSSLSRAKLVEVLQGRGLTLVAEDATGETVVAGGHTGEPLHGRPTRLRTPTPVLATPEGVDELAATLFTTGDGRGTLTQHGLWSEA